MAQAKKKAAASKKKTSANTQGASAPDVTKGEEAVELTDGDGPPEKLRGTPNWGQWNKRNKISLFHAICLAHNINTSVDTFNRLIDADKNDARLKYFDTHLNTLKDHFYFNATLRAFEKKTLNPDRNTFMVLRDFIRWVKDEHPFDDLNLTKEFSELNPPEPPAQLIYKEAPDLTTTQVNEAETQQQKQPAVDARQGVTENNKIGKKAANSTSNQYVSDADFLDGGRTNASQLALGLLLRYILVRAVDGSPPPHSLHTDDKKKLKLLTLHKQIIGFVKERTDQMSKKDGTSSNHSASPEAITRALRESVRVFGKHFVYDENLEGVIKKTGQ